MSMAAADAPVDTGGTLATTLSLSLAFTHTHTHRQTPTNEAEDVPDGGHQDDQGVGPGQQSHGDDDVTDPAELLGLGHVLVDGGTDLHRVEEEAVSRRAKAKSR